MRTLAPIAITCTFVSRSIDAFLVPAPWPDVGMNGYPSPPRHGSSPPPPDDPGGCGRPALPVAGDAGWLLNANGFDGAVAEVGVAPNAKGVGPGWPNVDGLAGCDCWPNPPLVLGPKANGALGAEEEA